MNHPLPQKLLAICFAHLAATAFSAGVGIFFGFLAAALIIALNSYLFVHWDVVLLAILAGAVFAVALGLFFRPPTKTKPVLEGVTAPAH